MTYEGFTVYTEDDFRGYAKHDVLEDGVETFLDNMDAAGIDYKRVLDAFEQTVKERSVN